MWWEPHRSETDFQSCECMVNNQKGCPSLYIQWSLWFSAISLRVKKFHFLSTSLSALPQLLVYTLEISWGERGYNLFSSLLEMLFLLISQLNILVLGQIAIFLVFVWGQIARIFTTYLSCSEQKCNAASSKCIEVKSQWDISASCWVLWRLNSTMMRKTYKTWYLSTASWAALGKLSPKNG